VKWRAADIPEQTGKTAVVIGANSGIGFHTALELARAGATVVVAVRDEVKGQAAIRGCRPRCPMPTCAWLC
jgi:NAD(P)-dependent dehydrogenase (short-subunit alcohol dehydrogenase family)